MAIFRGSKIRGEQIQDRSIQGNNIAQQTLTNEHFAAGAAIAESKLDVNWHAHTEALQDKKLVDFVQANGIKASGTAVTNLETQLPAIAGVQKASSSDSVEGIICDYPKNNAPVRDSITGEPIVTTINSIDYEVIGRMEFDAALSKYVLRFYTASGVDGAEQPFDLGTTEISVDIQYAQRFNLLNVGEMFAANEKFVHGAADVTAYLNIEQVAKDLYGTTWKLDRDGNGNLAISLADQISLETTRAQNAESAVTAALSTETANRTNADTAFQGKLDIINGDSTVSNSIDNKIKVQVTEPLANTQAGKGASLIGISTINGLAATTVQSALQELKSSAGDALVQLKADLASTADGLGANLIAVEASANFGATTVEGVLEDHKTRVDKLEATLSSATDRAASADGYFAAKSNFANIDERFEDDEKIVDANLKRIDDRDSADRTRSTASANKFFAAGQAATVAARFAEIETVVDDKAQEVTTARGTKSSLNERLSVAMRADGFLVDDKKIHTHKKYTVILTENKSVVNLPTGEYFNINNPTGNGIVLQDSVQVYINGILQANGINFTEIADTVSPTHGVGANFGTEQLVAGDVVIFEYVLNNAN